MVALARIAIGLLLLQASAGRAEFVARWRPLVEDASTRFGVPARWIEAVMRAESDGRMTVAGRPITSSAGAIGLMQLMPSTWTELRRSLALGNDPYDPHDNITAGTAYLRQMYDRFGYPGLFAAYNAGPARYAAVRATGARLPRETRAYLASVGGLANVDRAPSTNTRSDRLFAVRHDGYNAASAEVIDNPGSAMFVSASRH